MRIRWPRRSRIGVVRLFGIIGGSIRTPAYVSMLDAVREDGSIKAVVLDINSPGGSATASDYLYMSVAKLVEEKPVVAFIREAGASGAYLISCAATKIVAIPSALIGSIGVLSVRPVVQDLMQRMGVKVAVTKSGHLKDMGAVYREDTEEEVQKRQELLDEFYDYFIEAVAQARGLDEEVVRGYATGEVFTAKKAQELGLIDELGDLDRALDLASELGKVPRRLVYVKPRRPRLQRFISGFTDSLVEEVAAELEHRLIEQIWY
ncbi:MAG: signal peptide peptidase SppA [Anaerolineae bacterium]